MLPRGKYLGNTQVFRCSFLNSELMKHETFGMKHETFGHWSPYSHVILPLQLSMRHLWVGVLGDRPGGPDRFREVAGIMSWNWQFTPKGKFADIKVQIHLDAMENIGPVVPFDPWMAVATRMSILDGRNLDIKRILEEL